MNAKPTIYLIAIFMSTALFSMRQNPFENNIKYAPINVSPFSFPPGSFMQPGQTTTEKPTFFSKAGDTAANALIGAVVTGLTGYAINTAINKLFAAPDKQKEINDQIKAIELERLKNDALLIEEFRKIEREYLVCRNNNKDCTKLAEAFIRIGGQSAMDIINKNS